MQVQFCGDQLYSYNFDHHSGLAFSRTGNSRASFEGPKGYGSMKRESLFKKQDNPTAYDPQTRWP